MIVNKHGQHCTQTPVKGQSRAHGSIQAVTRSADGTGQGQRPRGRGAVMAAVLDAATALFATRGPASVSVRDIAAAAGVNHALVHRHFGSKQAVLTAVLERAAREVAAVAAEINDSRAGMGRLFQAAIEHEAYWRALARAILDGENPRELQRDFPTVRRMIELLRTERQQPLTPAAQHPPPPPLDPSVVVGTTSALMLGWLMFEPFLLAATGHDQHDLEKVREQVVLMLQAMIARPQPGGGV